MQFPKLHRLRLVYIFYFDGLQMDFEELLYFWDFFFAMDDWMMVVHFSNLCLQFVKANRY